MSDKARKKFKTMATASKAAIEDFRDDAEDRAIAWAADEIKRLRGVMESCVAGHDDCCNYVCNKIKEALAVASLETHCANCGRSVPDGALLCEDPADCEQVEEEAVRSETSGRSINGGVYNSTAASSDYAEYVVPKNRQV